MSEIKHAPGPWIVEWCGYRPGKATSVHPVLRADAIAQRTLFGKDYRLGAANARLISAAPDLLAACKELVVVAAAMLRVIQRFGDAAFLDWNAEMTSCGIADGVGMRAKAAIAKAEDDSIPS